MWISIDISLGAAFDTNSRVSSKRVTDLKWFFWDSRGSAGKRIFVVWEVLGF